MAMSLAAERPRYLLSYGSYIVVALLTTGLPCIVVAALLSIKSLQPSVVIRLIIQAGRAALRTYSACSSYPQNSRPHPLPLGYHQSVQPQRPRHVFAFVCSFVLSVLLPPPSYLSPQQHVSSLISLEIEQPVMVMVMTNWSWCALAQSKQCC